MSQAKDKNATPGAFPPTDWNEMRRLKTASEEEQRAIIDLLCTKYYQPIFQYVSHQWWNVGEPQDLVQEFFVHALEKGLFVQADETKGRFRNYLLHFLKWFMLNQLRKKGQDTSSLEEMLENDPLTPSALTDSTSPDVIFHRTWLRQVIDRSLLALEKDYENKGQLNHLNLFRSRVMFYLGEMDPPTVKQQAAELGIEVKKALNQIGTARDAFEKIVRKEIKAYAFSGDDARREKQEILGMIHFDGILL